MVRLQRQIGNSRSFTNKVWEKLAHAKSVTKLPHECVYSPDRELLRACTPSATPARGSVPRDTLQAVVNIARYPWQNVESLFETVADRYSVPACSFSLWAARPIKKHS